MLFTKKKNNKIKIALLCSKFIYLSKSLQNNFPHTLRDHFDILEQIFRKPKI